jgi:hypothetical protein
MQILKRTLALLFYLISCSSYTYSQDTTTVSFLQEIKNFDLSTILTADSILIEDLEDNKDKIKRAEILGFIGEDYQRIHLRYISIIQNPTNTYEYLVYGKTMVKGTVRSFQGTITIFQARTFIKGDFAKYKQGYADCQVTLYEDKKETSTGMIKGKLRSNFIIDDKGKFRYDAVMFGADGFWNNQFIGTWTSYKTKISKKCNWGDYRIPESRDLDIGAGEFSPSDKYVKNGWVSYMLENKVPNGAIQRQTIGENREWWQEQ